MAVPRIVIVDDDRRVSHMLRSSLKFTGQAYTIVDVPSAEEAFLEIERGGADLLVTDLRLPGISGLEMLEKVRKSRPSLRSIVITGHPSEEARSRAIELGVVEFLTKPIRTSRFLEAVNVALQLTDQDGESPVEEEKAFIAEWLLTMQRELGAEATLLLDGDGAVLVRAGDLDTIDLKATLPSLMTATGASLEVSRSLGEDVPASLMYFEGPARDLYLATVGEEHALAIVFPAKGGAGQISAVLQYSRRAARDLVNALYNVAAVASKAAAAGSEAPGGERTASVETRAVNQEKGSMPDEKQPPEEAPKEAAPEPDFESAADLLSEQDANEYWDEAASSGETGPISEDTLTYDEARKRGLLPKDSEE